MNAFWRIETGDCRDLLRAMEPASVQCVVTSPPYWGLRDYGHEGQLGLERTPEEYVTQLVEVFREVRRVLRNDGTVWLNLGDCYASSPPGNVTKGVSASSTLHGIDSDRYRESLDSGHATKRNTVVPGLKPKDLVGIPWRVAFALQQDGWYLRAETIWAKPNPMPESVGDRPTRAHEQVFLLTKSQRYFYDAFSIRESSVGGHGSGVTERADNHQADRSDLSTRVPWEHQAARNKRSVWEIPTVPFKGTHFATFPPKLVDPCVQAGTPEAGCCVECGAPRQRIVNKVRTLDGGEGVEGTWDHDEAGRIGAAGVGHWRYETTVETLGWRPTCVCGAPAGIEPDDMELIASPTGEGGGEDPSQKVGRAGYLRPRADGGGLRVMTRFQQRRYAEQLRGLRAETIKRDLEITDDAWAHYIRTDRAGARPLPPDKLATLLASGLLDPVEPPDWELPETRPAVVLDPFSGAGTTGMVSLRFGRSFVGCELSETYAEMSRDRIRDDAPLFNTGAERPLEAA
jgi:DNA modification methylase